MNFDYQESELRDVIGFLIVLLLYFFSLWVYKKIDNIEKRKWTGTCIGFWILCSVFGAHIWHFVLFTIGAVILIKNTNTMKCHLVLFNYVMSYLTMFRIHMLDVPRDSFIHVNYILMLITVKIMGLSYEIYNSHLDKKSVYPEEGELPIDPEPMDIIHYIYSYFGMFSPYVRFRTFDDFIHLPFSKYADSREYVKRMYFVPLYMLTYGLLQRFWPLEFMLTNGFYEKSLLYKCAYTIIQGQKFKFWAYTGTVLSECICSAAGFGAYPDFAQSKSTHGPTKDYDKLKQITTEEAKKLTYDYNTISNMDIYTTQFCPWFTKACKSWNKSIQYFMAMYFYKSLPKTTILKPFRMMLTIGFCAYWHGLDPGYQIGMLLFPLYAPIERIYMKIYEQTGYKLIEIIMYVIFTFISAFGTVSFLLLDLDKVLTFHRSMYYFPYVFLLCLYLFGIFAQSIMKKRRQS